jgi:predicted transcriptional regulator
MFYVTKPVGEVAGYAEFVERKAGDSEALWKAHGRESVLSSKEEFEEFVRDRKKVSFVRFKNLREAAKPISLNNLLLLLGMKRLGRGGFFVDKETSEKMIALME